MSIPCGDGSVSAVADDEGGGVGVVMVIEDGREGQATSGRSWVLLGCSLECYNRFLGRCDAMRMTVYTFIASETFSTFSIPSINYPRSSSWLFPCRDGCPPLLCSARETKADESSMDPARYALNVGWLCAVSVRRAALLARRPCAAGANDACGTSGGIRGVLDTWRRVGWGGGEWITLPGFRQWKCPGSYCGHRGTRVCQAPPADAHKR
jgi:hypothetical protein